MKNTKQQVINNNDNGSMLISGIIQLHKIAIKKMHDDIYLNVQIIKALRKSQDNSGNTIVKNVIQNNINKLCNENDNIYKNIVELGGQ